LHTAEVEEAQVLAEELSIKHFLMAMHHLKNYPKGTKWEAMHNISTSSLAPSPFPLQLPLSSPLGVCLFLFLLELLIVVLVMAV
jgi:hypothetical protein